MRKGLLALILVGISGYVGFLLGKQALAVEFRNYKPTVVLNRETAQPKEVDFSMFWLVWDKLARSYVDKTAINSQKMVEGAIAGMVAALGDPYTVYLPKKANEDAKADLGGAFEGVGIQLGYKEKVLAVVAPLEGTPAKAAGVKPGDLIVHVKDEAKKIDRDTDGMTVPEAVGIIRGPKGTGVELTLIREGKEEPIKVLLTRDTIVVKSVVLEINDNVAHLKLNRFGDRTQEEWNEAVAQIVAKGARGMVLDLRNNPGGYLDGAVYLASEFLPVGKTVVIQQHGDGTKQESKVTRGGKLQKIALVVLVNEGSASASEILAGALADWHRAKIVGMKSFGKGSVQQPDDFADGSGIHITIARWLRPSGEWIDKKGITPDVEVKPENGNGDETKDVQLEKARELL